MVNMHFSTFDHVLLVNDSSLVMGNGEHAFSSRRYSLEYFFLSERSGVTILGDWLLDSGL